MKAWILTEEYNDYDQHGEYFVAWFPEKPTTEELSKYFDEDTSKHILTGGGGRRQLGLRWEEHWYFLKEIESGFREDFEPY
jgi:hypothetical protein